MRSAERVCRAARSVSRGGRSRTSFAFVGCSPCEPRALGVAFGLLDVEAERTTHDGRHRLVIAGGDRFERLAFGLAEPESELLRSFGAVHALQRITLSPS